MNKALKLNALILASVMLLSAFTGCTSIQTSETTNVTITSDLYFSEQDLRKSPEWVTKLAATKDAEQLIVVAGVDKTTAYVTMHEKNAYGEWEQIIATPRLHRS